jgi:alanine-alpha-ketoisovalerate/valine-pyruvate aminotransferase
MNTTAMAQRWLQPTGILSLMEDLGTASNILSATPLLVSITDRHIFTYGVNFVKLTIGQSVGATIIAEEVHPAHATNHRRSSITMDQPQ